ncbi:MAG: metallophosphoesterase [Bacteroidetes bacterium]|nr:metallophosphoesterase [Bacteroidota bacterium]
MRILTFSDVHYKEGYNNNRFIKNYIAAFKSKIESLIEEKEIDLCVIGGDISFSGSVIQYQEFAEMIRNVIPKEIPIFSIVGNHEVDWTSLSAALGDKTLLDLFEIPKSEINKNINEFKKVFSNYFLCFQRDINKTASLSFSYKFSDKHYAGYVYNEEEEVLILLLNSAWYSFGPGVVKGFYEKWISDKSNIEIKNQAFSLLGDALSQEGKQSYFLDHFPYFTEVNDLLENKPSTKVITFAHHPPSWLKWDELYNDKNYKRDFSTLINMSDALVTGHVHNPVSMPSVLQNKCFHFNNGIFMDYHFIDEDADKDNPDDIFPNNWFNILDIESTEISHSSYKFFAEKKTVKNVSFEYHWKKKNDEDSVYYFKDLKKVSASAVGQKNSPKKVKNKNLAEPIIPFFPKTIEELIKILKNKRKNAFMNPNPEIKRLDLTEPVELLFNNEVYCILVNKLDDFFSHIHASETYEELKQNHLFKRILEKIENEPDGKLPIIAFYDLLRTVNEEDTDAFESYEQSRFITFQAFKHRFFVNFPALHKFTELNIVFDTILQ